MTLSRRPATAADQEYAREVHHLGYRDVVERQFGVWDESVHDDYFDAGWPRHDHEILQWDGEPCGYAVIDFTATRVDVQELVVHPDYQGRGIGSEILRQTILRAQELGADLYLQVFLENHAVDLYERHGLVEYEQTATHRLMRLENE